VLRQAGLSAQAATERLLGLSVADKNELLFQHGINFNELPAWQKRAAGVVRYVWPNHPVPSGNPSLTNEGNRTSAKVGCAQWTYLILSLQGVNSQPGKVFEVKTNQELV